MKHGRRVRSKGGRPLRFEYKIEYLRRNIDEDVAAMHERVASVCSLYANSGWTVVCVDFESAAVEVWIVLQYEVWSSGEVPRP